MSPVTRRRRIGAPSDPQPHHLTFPPPKRGSICKICGASDQNRRRNQNPDQDQTDLISHLPDCVLSSILSLLPIKESIRTSILSSRWRDLWKLNPLHLDDSTVKSSHLNRQETRQSVTRIASVHPGPIHSFRISQFDELAFHHEVDDLIETLTRKGIRELALSFGYQGKFRYRLPLPLLQCQTLRKLSLSDCFFPPSPFVCSSFPNLRELMLEFVFLWDDLLHCLLKSCAQLEVLELVNCSGLQYVRLNCAKLRKLTISEDGSGPYTKDIVIENATELRSLRFGEMTVAYTRFSVQHVQKLEELGLFSMEATMRLGNTFSRSHNQYQMSVNGSMVLSTIKKLAILVGFTSGHMRLMLPSVLRCFPCLESLEVKSVKPLGFGPYGPEVGVNEQQAPFGFFERHLKSLTLINFFGLKAEVEFLKFFVRHGRVLQKITIFCHHKLTATWEKSKRREMRFKDRVSKDLEVVFLSMSDCNSDSCVWEPMFHRDVTGLREF